MRGKDFYSTVQEVRTGITPAYAGKRIIMPDENGELQDHPRLCGEKSKYSSSNSLSGGSPPPMRGKAVETGFVNHDCGITPAYAGKSGLSICWQLFQWDHPRLCGEKLACKP